MRILLHFLTIFMDNQSSELRPETKKSVPPTTANDHPWWQQGVALFGEVTGWIVVPLIAALYIGKYLDKKQGTGILYFLSLTALAFIISCIGIARLGIKYIRQMEEQDRTKKNNEHIDPNN